MDKRHTYNFRGPQHTVCFVTHSLICNVDRYKGPIKGIIYAKSIQVIKAV